MLLEVMVGLTQALCHGSMFRQNFEQRAGDLIAIAGPAFPPTPIENTDESAVVVSH